MFVSFEQKIEGSPLLVTNVKKEDAKINSVELELSDSLAPFLNKKCNFLY
jgi:hypothetical protein